MSTFVSLSSFFYWCLLLQSYHMNFSVSSLLRALPLESFSTFEMMLTCIRTGFAEITRPRIASVYVLKLIHIWSRSVLIERSCFFFATSTRMIWIDQWFSHDILLSIVSSTTIDLFSKHYHKNTKTGRTFVIGGSWKFLSRILYNKIVGTVISVLSPSSRTVSTDNLWS